MAQVPSRLEAVLQNGYQFKLGEYISKGFNIFGKNVGIFIGFFLINIVLSFITNLLPLIGIIISLLISGALNAGFYIISKKTDKGEHLEFSNAFDGFKDWVQLFLVSLITIVIALVAMIPVIAYIFSKFSMAELAGGDMLPSDIVSSLNFGILFLLILIPMLLLFTYMYAPLFIVFDKLDAWSAMEASRKTVMKNFGMHILFAIVWGFILLLSALPLFLGLLATIPAYYASLYAAWSDITDFNNEGEDKDDLLKHFIQ